MWLRIFLLLFLLNLVNLILVPVSSLVVSPSCVAVKSGCEATIPFTIFNDENVDLRIYVTVDGISDFATVSPRNFTLKSGESKIVVLKVKAPEEGEYKGYLNVTADYDGINGIRLMSMVYAKILVGHKAGHKFAQTGWLPLVTFPLLASTLIVIIILKFRRKFRIGLRR